MVEQLKEEPPTENWKFYSPKDNFCLYSHPLIIMKAFQTRGFHPDSMNRYVLFFWKNADRLFLSKGLLSSILTVTLERWWQMGSTKTMKWSCPFHLGFVSSLSCCNEPDMGSSQRMCLDGDGDQSGEELEAFKSLNLIKCFAISLFIIELI